MGVITLPQIPSMFPLFKYIYCHERFFVINIPLRCSVGDLIQAANKQFKANGKKMVAVHSNIDDYVELVGREIQRCLPIQLKCNIRISNLQL